MWEEVGYRDAYASEKDIWVKKKGNSCIFLVITGGREKAKFFISTILPDTIFSPGINCALKFPPPH